MQTFTTIKEIVDRAAIQYADNRAFTLKEKNGREVQYKNITYREFHREIQALSAAFTEKDLNRIAIIGKNSYKWAVCYFASVCTGYISIPLDKGLPCEELAECLKRSGAQILFYDEDHIRSVKELSKQAEFQNVRFVYFGSGNKADDAGQDETFEDYMLFGSRYIEENGSAAYENISVKGDDICSILFTSGTTSNSKAVVLTNNNIASNVCAINQELKFYEDDVNVAFLPFHHTFGNIANMIVISNGACTVFCDGLKYIQQNLREYQATLFVAVPLLLEGIYEKVIKQVKKQGRYNKLKTGVVLASALKKLGIDRRKKIFSEIHEQFGGKIRLIISGASAINKEVARGYNLIGIDLIQGYGLTETSPVVSAERVGDVRYGSVGRPLGNLEVKIDCPDEKGTGEIVVKGPSVMQGYYNDPEETAKILKNGWFYTGDLGYFDKDGYLYIKGRKKNVIVLKNGKNIYPEEIEELLNNISYISECIVYGVDKKEDLVVCAKLVYDREQILLAHPELDFLAAGSENELSAEQEESLKKAVWREVEEVSSKMPSYKRIKRITVTDVPMEKTGTAKIKRYKAIK